MGSKPSTDKRTTINTHHMHHHSPSKRRNSDMPLFGHKQSDESKKKLEHCLYLARESPEPVFDISRCEISEIPSGVFSLCKVFRKEAILVHNNWLSSFRGGGSLRDLAELRVLDIHNNEIHEIPDEIGELISLQVFNISNNKVKKLPKSIGNLHALQSLIVKGNKLQALPQEICNLISLRTLDISKNGIKSLPKDFCQIRTLENLIVDVKQMSAPPSAICSEGTDAIMKYLCSVAGINYIPPSKFLLKLLDVPPMMSPSFSAHSLKAIQDDDNAFQDTLTQYEKAKEQKRLQSVELERQLEEHQREQSDIISKAAEQREDILDVIAEDQDRMDKGIKSQVERSHREQQQLVSVLYQIEKNSQLLMNQLLQMNEKARKTEELLEALERERMELDETFKFAYEEHNNLREKDVLESMHIMLKDTYNLELLRQSYEARKKKKVPTATLR